MNSISQRKNKLAIFDIDGTLTDSVLIHQSAFIIALEKFGLSDFDTNWNNYKHHTDTSIFKTIFETHFNKAVTNTDINRFEDILYALIVQSTSNEAFKRIKGVNRFLYHLNQNSDFDVVFATGSLLKPAILKLKQAGIAVAQDLISAANHLYTREEIVLSAIERAKIFYTSNRYNQIISFGDGLWDAKTAEMLNIDFIGIQNEELLNYGIKIFFKDFKDLQLYSLMGINKLIPYPDFQIQSSEQLSQEFIKRNILNFYDAVSFISGLPYRRNANKANLITVFSDSYGTCSTKHALLRQLAIENNIENVKLKLGIFKMNKYNTPEVKDTLAKYNLTYIPEAHCYLTIGGHVIDCTNDNSFKAGFTKDLISEIEIEPDQITNFKVDYHKRQLKHWLNENPHLHYSLDTLFAIREECIKDLELYSPTANQ